MKYTQKCGSTGKKLNHHRLNQTACIKWLCGTKNVTAETIKKFVTARSVAKMESKILRKYT